MSACTPATAPQIDEVLLVSGGDAGRISVTVNSKGEGRYERISAATFARQSASFRFGNEQFKRLVERLEPYRREARPLTLDNALARDCPERAPYVTDAGGVGITWKGPSFESFYTVDFGCDAERHAARNQALRSMLDQIAAHRK